MHLCLICQVRRHVLLCLSTFPPASSDMNPGAAVRFYKDAKGAHVLLDNHFCRDWAETAGRLALREVEFPNLDNVVVFLNLALFWYSTGDFQRSQIHSGLAPHFSPAPKTRRATANSWYVPPQHQPALSTPPGSWACRAKAQAVKILWSSRSGADGSGRATW